jgi:integrase/recombinase XerD
MQPEQLSFSEAIDGFELWMHASGYSQSTVSTYSANLRRISRAWDNPDLNDIERSDLLNYLATLKKSGRSPETVRTYLKNLHLFFSWLADEFEIPRPDLNIKSPSQKTESDVMPLSEQEVRAILKAANGKTDYIHPNNRSAYRMARHDAKRDTAIIYILLDTGMRVSEAARLTIQDIDLKTGEIHIHAHETGKKSKPRTVYIKPATCSKIWSYLNQRKKRHGQVLSTDPLFITKTRRSMNRNSIRKVLSSIGEKAGVSGVHPHRLRHTFAIEYLRNGGDPFTLQRILGHSSLRMVNYYLALAREDVQTAHRAASPVEGWNL